MPTVASVDRAAGGGRPFDTGPAAAGAVAYCAAHGWEVAIEFVEPCASGIDERRPELQRLLDMALTKAPPSMSWWFIPSAASPAIISHSNSRCGAC